MILGSVALSTERLNAIVTIVCAAISALVSWQISKSTTKKELRQTKALWTREDIKALEAKYLEMEFAVITYICVPTQENQIQALIKVMAIRGSETDDLAFLLDELYEWIGVGNIPKVSASLDSLVIKKRKLHCWDDTKAIKHLKKN